MSIPGDFTLEWQIIDAIETIDSATQWIGPRPAGFLEAEAQKVLSGEAGK